MNKSDEDHFFNAISSAWIDEDMELRNLFQSNSLLYAKHHHGICFLYETTLVYLGIKNLIKSKFPYCVSWEHPYPNIPSKKADLGILDQNQDVHALVEFKIWLTEEGSEVRSDVLKYSESNFDGGKYLIVIEYFGPNINDNCNYLLKENPELEYINCKQFISHCYDWNNKIKTEKPINLYFLKMKKRHRYYNK